MKDPNKVKQGKINRAAGARFELKVRKDLESKGWIVSKWQNNVEFLSKDLKSSDLGKKEVALGKLVAAKHKFRGKGIPMSIGTGFPDFISFKKVELAEHHNYSVFEDKFSIKANRCVIGVEVKSAKYLDKIEKEKCRWLLENNVFSKILIAYKGKEARKTVVKYKEFGK